MSRQVLICAALCSVTLVAVVALQAVREPQAAPSGVSDTALSSLRTEVQKLQDETLARLDGFERRLRDLGAGLDESLPPANGSNEIADPDEDGEDGPAIDIESASSSDVNGKIVARMDTIERRLDSLESDPVERGYRYIESESAELRRQGIQALERVAARDPEARAAIRGLLQDGDSSVRWWALDTLADLGDKESIDAISAMLSDDDAKVRSEAINSLNRLKATGSAAEVASLYGDADAKVRVRVIDTIGDLRYADGADILVQALGDSSRDVRREAIDTLRNFDPKAIDSEAVVGPLRALYDNHPSDDRLRIAMSLRRFGDGAPYQAELQRLSETALNSTNERAQRDAIRALGYYMRNDAAAVLQQLASESQPNARIRGEAARALNPSRGRRR